MTRQQHLTRFWSFNRPGVLMPIIHQVIQSLRNMDSSELLDKYCDALIHRSYLISTQVIDSL